MIKRDADGGATIGGIKFSRSVVDEMEQDIRARQQERAAGLHAALTPAEWERVVFSLSCQMDDELQGMADRIQAALLAI